MDDASKPKSPPTPNDVFMEQISYLGCAKIDQPSSETEMLKIMELLNRERAQNPIDVVLSIPDSAMGVVQMYDGSSKLVMMSFPVHRIRFCARGQLDSNEKECFALSYTQQNATAIEPAVHNCYVFRCQVPESAGKALLCFANAFQTNRSLAAAKAAYAVSDPCAPSPSVPNSSRISSDLVESTKSSSPEGEDDYQFDAFLEMREEDGKKGFTLCPQEKNCFKLRRDREKRVVVVLQQTSGPNILAVRKCFGLLLAAGRNLQQSDMHLLDMQSMGRGNDEKTYIIEALWDPHAKNFEVLNTETPRETRVFMTIAVDVILTSIDEPVRFNMECKARIFHEHERFWYVTRRPIVEKYFLTVKAMKDDEGSHLEEMPNSSRDSTLQVVKFESVTERERAISRLSLGRSPTKMPTQLIQPADDDESDSDEPLLSGSGDVNQECSDDILSKWRTLLEKWKSDPEGLKPDELCDLIRGGVPDILRGEVWQYLAKVQLDQELLQTYRLLLGKECPSEQVILRDIHRTFPAHEYFKEAGGEGQEALYKISKAYSLYDEEVSYCQGLSFLAAALLLHMPEEQAFCVLVKIMFDYGLRDLFKLGFDVLQLRFYQLQRLTEDYIPDLFAHFYDLGVETHMYASQWFLTLFTAKFPLQMVYFIVDLFLSEGMYTIFHISLALLKASKMDLLQLDFEGVLKYFRVTLPRKYRTEATAKELIHQAVKLKISHKRLTKYEKEYYSLKERELESQDPVERLERENLRQKETIMRLERENDDLAHELVTSKIELRRNLDSAEDSVESLQNQLERCSRANKDLEDENKNIHGEYEQVKEMCRREVKRLESEALRSQGIIDNYKKICTSLNQQLEKQKEKEAERSREIMIKIAECERCSSILNDVGKITGSPVKEVNFANGDSCHLNPLDLIDKLEQREHHIRQIELELAQTKLALVEAQCRNQDLTHQMNSAMNNESDSRHAAWLRKTISSIKEVGTSLKQQGHERNASISSVERY